MEESSDEVQNPPAQELDVLLSKVKNKTVLVNPHFPNAPFNFKEGESARLGLFADKKASIGETGMILEPRLGHKRSISLGSVSFTDDQGRIYNEVDLKGIGYVQGGYGKTYVSPIMTEG